MNEFQIALARIQESANKLIAKVDALSAGNDAQLQEAASKLNAVSDALDAKSA